MGIVRQAGIRWWRVEFHRSGAAEHGYSDTFPTLLEVDVFVCLGEEVANAILEKGQLDSKMVIVEGDRPLVQQFMSRYLRQRSALSIRAGGQEVDQCQESRFRGRTTTKRSRGARKRS